MEALCSWNSVMFHYSLGVKAVKMTSFETSKIRHMFFIKYTWKSILRASSRMLCETKTNVIYNCELSRNSQQTGFCTRHIQILDSRSGSIESPIVGLGLV